LSGPACAARKRYRCLVRKKELVYADIQISCRRRSTHLDDDPLEDVGDVFQAIGDFFHRLVDVLPLDDLNAQ
jgi:hypothetical protein